MTAQITAACFPELLTTMAAQRLQLIISIWRPPKHMAAYCSAQAGSWNIIPEPSFHHCRQLIASVSGLHLY